MHQSHTESPTPAFEAAMCPTIRPSVTAMSETLSAPVSRNAAAIKCSACRIKWRTTQSELSEAHSERALGRAGDARFHQIHVDWSAKNALPVLLDEPPGALAVSE